MANKEAMVVGFIAENSQALPLPGKLIELSKEFSKDKAALKRLKMHRTTAPCKLTYGLGETCKSMLVSALQKRPLC